MDSPSCKSWLNKAESALPQAGADLQSQNVSRSGQIKARCHESIGLKKSDAANPNPAKTMILDGEDSCPFESVSLQTSTLGSQVMTTHKCSAQGLIKVHDTSPDGGENPEEKQPSQSYLASGARTKQPYSDSIILEEDIAFCRQLNTENDRLCAILDAEKAESRINYLCATPAERLV